MDCAEEVSAWPALVTRAYLSELACEGGAQGSGLFFWRILELSGWTPDSRDPQEHARTIEGYTKTYLQLFRDGSLALAEELATSATVRAELRVADDASLFACIAATLYCKPVDPVGGELCRGSPFHIQDKIEGVRKSILRRLRYLLMNHPKLAILGTARLRDAKGEDVFGYGSEGIGIVGYSHFARESLLFALLSLRSGAPEQFFIGVRDALDGLTKGPGGVPAMLNNQHAIAGSAFSRLVRAVIQPARTDLAKLRMRGRGSGANRSHADRLRSRDDQETNGERTIASYADHLDGSGPNKEDAIGPSPGAGDAAVGSLAEDRNVSEEHAGDGAAATLEYPREEHATLGRIWNLSNPMDPPRMLRGHEGSTRALAFDPRGRWIAAITDKWEAGLWDLSSESLAWRWLTHKGPVRALAVDPRGRWLAGRGRGPNVELWRLDDPEAPALSLGGHKGLVTSLAFDSNGETLAAGSIQGVIRLWGLADLRTGSSKVKPRELSVPEIAPRDDEPDNESVLIVAFDPKVGRLASGWLSGLVRVWRLSPAAVDEPLVFDTGRGAVLALVFDPRERWLAAGGEDGKVCLLDPARPETSPIALSGCVGSIGAIAFDPSGRWLTAIDERGTPCQWDCETKAARGVCAPEEAESVRATVFAPDARWLATGGDQGKILLWDLVHPEAPPLSLHGGETPVLALAFGSDGAQLAAGYADVPGAPATVRDGPHWKQHMAPTPLDRSKELKALQAKRKGILIALKPLRLAALRRPLRDDSSTPIEENLSARDDLERQLARTDEQIAQLRAQQETMRKSKPVGKDTIMKYRPILEAVLRSVESSERVLDIKGQSVPARDYFRLRFAAQWISALTGRDYTHNSRDQILSDLEEVFSRSGDPVTGSALRAFSALVGAPENEVWGRGHDAALKAIIIASLRVASAPPAEEMLRDLRSKVGRALDDCFDADVEDVIAQSPATVDLAEPTTLLDIYWRSLYLKSLYSKAVRPAALGPRAAIRELVSAAQALALAEADQVLPRLIEVLPTVQGLDSLEAPNVTTLEKAATKLKTARTGIRTAADRDEILTNESLRREYFLLQAAVGIVEGEAKRLKQVAQRSSNIDPRKVKRFFTQTFSRWAGEDDGQDDQERPTWHVKDWTLLARGLCRDEVLPQNAWLYERVRLRFESSEESDLREVFQDLIAQRIDNVPFVAAFTGAVDGCLQAAESIEE